MTPPIAIHRRLPSPCENPDWSNVIYPDPPSHDFVTWTVIAEMMRRHHKAPGPLKVTLLLRNGMLGTVDFGPFSVSDGRAYQCGCDRAYSDQMIPNIMVPAIDMIGAVRQPDLNMEGLRKEDLARYVEYDYHIGHLIDAARQGHEVPRFTPPEWAEQEVDDFLASWTRPVVITLRETTVQPERNSQLIEWLAFAKSIERDHPVLFVRDTAKASEPLPPGFPTWPRASLNSYVRAALYRRAFCNLTVCTGPVNWCNFTDAPVLIFKQLIPALAHCWEGGTPKGWREQCHLEVGEQLPWASPRQRLTWTDDTFENIKAAFEGFQAAC